MLRRLLRSRVVGALVAAKDRKRKLPKAPLLRAPASLSRTYLAELLPMLQFAKQLVDSRLPAIRGLLERSRQLRGDDFRTDDTPNDIQRELGSIKIAFQRRYSAEEAERVAKRMAERGKTYAATQVQETFRKVIGIDIVTSSPAIEEVASAAVIENVNLIQSIPSRYFEEIEREVMTVFRTGANTEDLVDLLQERYDVSRSRATLIAVDQTNKLNGNLTQATQQQNGVTHYIWRTSQDERVRDSHRLLDGRRFAWNDAPEVGHPGQDYRCRCQAEADIEGMLETLEAE